MYKAVSVIIYLSYMCCLPFNSNAQIDIVIAGKKYHCSQFIDNKVYPNTSQFVTDSVIPPIIQSKYNLEIRYTLSSNWDGFDGHCIIIRGNRDSLQATYYFAHGFSKADFKGKFKDSVRIIHRYDHANTTDKFGVYIKPVKPAEPLDELLKKLFDNHIGDTPNDYDVVQQLKTKGVYPKAIPCMDCVDFTFYEIKIGDHYRTIFVSNQYQDYNQKIPEFSYQRQLDAVFQALVSIKK